MTGARLAKVAPYLKGDDFMLTYGDGLSDVDVPSLRRVPSHAWQGRDRHGVRPPGRFGELAVTDDHRVRAFAEKPVGGDGGLINGGFFVFARRFLDYVTRDDDCTLEGAAARTLREGRPAHGLIITTASGSAWTPIAISSSSRTCGPPATRRGGPGELRVDRSQRVRDRRDRIPRQSSDRGARRARRQRDVPCPRRGVEQSLPSHRTSRSA